MNFKELLKEAIKNDTKIIITGRSGWGKSEMIQQVANEEGYELIDFRLSEVLPEDLVGIPKLRDDYYDYVPPRWLYEVVQHPEKKYLLFLDEITQGTPEVLNICYKIFDKVTKVGNYTLNNVAVVGATNYQDESNYLSELPQPLKNRACMIELDHNMSQASNYILDKFNIPVRGNTRHRQAVQQAIQNSNPRAVEKAINLILSGCSKSLVIPFVGYQSYQELSSVFIPKVAKPEDLSNIGLARNDLKNGYIVYNNEKYSLDEALQLKTLYKLTDEEYQVIQDEFDTRTLHEDASAFKHSLLVDILAANKDLTSTELYEVAANSVTFNPFDYIKVMKINPKTMTNQFEELKRLLNLDDTELLTKFLETRSLPIEVMKLYRTKLPWDILLVHESKGWLTMNKKKEFAKELAAQKAKSLSQI